MNYVVSKHVRTVFSCSYLKTINTYKCTCKQVVPNIKLRCFVTRPVSNEPSHNPFLALSNIANMSDVHSTIASVHPRPITAAQLPN